MLFLRIKLLIRAANTSYQSQFSHPINSCFTFGRRCGQSRGTRDSHARGGGGSTQFVVKARAVGRGSIRRALFQRRVANIVADEELSCRHGHLAGLV